MTTPTEKEEYVRIYEDIKRRQAEYEAAHPGKYYLLNEYEMDDIDSYHQIQTLEQAADRYQEQLKRGLVKPDHTPKKSLLQACLECGFIDARPNRRQP